LRLDIDKPEQVALLERRRKGVKQYLDDRRPRVDELPDNQGYVTWPNNEIKRQSFALPSFHHKTSMDDFKLDTGIDWTVNREKKPEESNLTKSETKQAAKQKKKIKEEIFKKIDYMRATQGKSWLQVKEELVLQEKEGIIPEMDYASKKPVYFSNEFGKWKKKQNTNDLDD